MGRYTLAGPMENFAEAHNVAVEYKANPESIEEWIRDKGKIIEVVESFDYMCMKCGDDFWTDSLDNVPRVSRWRCRTCVYDLF